MYTRMYIAKCMHVQMSIAYELLTYLQVLTPTLGGIIIIYIIYVINIQYTCYPKYRLNLLDVLEMLFVTSFIYSI